ncbi:unnamed protein product [Aspergillus oryzae]|nr:unnamed protein product [Aspergillus oryzae]
MSMHPRSRRTPSPITSSAMAPNDTESLISMTHPPATGPVTFVDTPTVSSSTPSLNFPKDLMSSIPSNLEEMSQGDSGANLALRCLTPPLDNHTSTASSSQVVKSLEWKGSFAISEQQWHQLASEQQWHHLASTLNIVRPVENLNDLKIPSRLTLERLLRAFAECFLIYIPCIHMPTWKAELAPPCMIFAMASIGASYYDDDATATSLHCIAQMCIKNHVSEYRKVSPYTPESDGGNDDILQQWQKWIDSEMTVRCVEQNPEFHCSPRYPSGVIAANALSLYRQAHVRLCGNFRPLRAALTTRNVQSITSRLNDIQVNISSSRTCVKAAWCAIEALQISIVMGMAQAGSISGWHSKLLFNTYSLECCDNSKGLFLSIWTREQLSRAISDRSSEENDILKTIQETLAEIDLDPAITSKPYSIQLVYAWSLIFKNSATIGLYGIIAEVLKGYADNLRG